jgi:hypothetical protein
VAEYCNLFILHTRFLLLHDSCVNIEIHVFNNTTSYFLHFPLRTLVQPQNLAKTRRWTQVFINHLLSLTHICWSHTAAFFRSKTCGPTPEAEVAKDQEKTTGQSLRALRALGASKAFYLGPGTKTLWLWIVIKFIYISAADALAISAADVLAISAADVLAISAADFLAISAADVLSVSLMF